MHILKEIVTKKREILARKSTEKNTNKNCLISFKVNDRFIGKGKTYKTESRRGCICRHDSIGVGQNE